MDHFPSTENSRPWWADVAHLRDESDHRDTTTATSRPSLGRQAEDLGLPAERPTASAGRRERPTASPAERQRSRRAPSDRPRTDWFAHEARSAGRRSTPRPDPSRPARPRATLVDVSPDHSLLRRAPQVRRAPGERPTVTITGHPEAALPPQVRPPQHLRARRTREQATSLVASPDRMILWAVALGLLMILASIGTASADAATTLTLLR